MAQSKYARPTFLVGRCTAGVYRRWLARRAAAHRKRDRVRGNLSATISAYKEAIHAAVLRGGERDAYTGERLRWDLISTYDNQASEREGRDYKKSFALLPSVDHVGDGLGAPKFRMCAWRTNDAKGDLSYFKFIGLCRKVLAHRRKIGRSSNR
jgi:hypothetical protein